MASFLLGFPNRIESATVSGGSWLAGAPVTNVATWALADTARSTNATTGSTKIRIDHGSAVTARVLALVRHNLSSAATVRWMRGTTGGASDVADSGSINAWQFTPRAYDGEVYDAQIVQTAQTSARYDEIEITDTGNAAGYVEIGRVFVGPCFAPAYNPVHGLADAHDDLSVVGRAYSGAAWPAPNRRLRRVQFELPALSTDEGATLHELEQIEGTTGEVLHLPYGNTADRQRFGMLGMLRQLDGILFPAYGLRGRSFVIAQRA